VLETGDPIVGVWYPLSGNPAGQADGYNCYGQYHPEEEVSGSGMPTVAWKPLATAAGTAG
jgi:hypothetical protein